jgi:hypothetical protein
VAEYPESVIRAEIGTRIHQGMDDEQIDAVEQRVRDKLADEPPIRPMGNVQLAIREAKGGMLSTDGPREREAYRLGVASLTNPRSTSTRGGHGV